MCLILLSLHFISHFNSALSNVIQKQELKQHNAVEEQRFSTFADVFKANYDAKKRKMFETAQ